MLTPMLGCAPIPALSTSMRILPPGCAFLLVRLSLPFMASSPTKCALHSAQMANTRTTKLVNVRQPAQRPQFNNMLTIPLTFAYRDAHLHPITSHRTKHLPVSLLVLRRRLLMPCLLTIRPEDVSNSAHGVISKLLLIIRPENVCLYAPMAHTSRTQLALACRPVQKASQTQLLNSVLPPAQLTLMGILVKESA